MAVQRRKRKTLCLTGRQSIFPILIPAGHRRQFPEPRGVNFPEFLFSEVAPLVNGAYRTKTGAEHTGLAGASFGGAAALYTVMNYPDRLSMVLVESPSLHVGNGALISEADKLSSWCGRLAVGAGTKEGDSDAAQRQMIENVMALQAAIEESSSADLQVTIVDGATHWYDAWRARLPNALIFLVAEDGNRC